MSPKKLTVAVAVSAFFLSACASTPEECDPRLDPGFLSKIGCTVTGSYGERIEQKEGELQALTEENKRLNDLIKSLDEQNALLSQDYKKRQAELDNMIKSVNALQASLAQKKALQGELQIKLQDVQAQLDELKKQPQQEVENETLLQKKMQIQELESQLEELRNTMLNGY